MRGHSSYYRSAVELEVERGFNYQSVAFPQPYLRSCGYSLQCYSPPLRTGRAPLWFGTWRRPTSDVPPPCPPRGSPHPHTRHPQSHQSTVQSAPLEARRAGPVVIAPTPRPSSVVLRLIAAHGDRASFHVRAGCGGPVW